MIGLDTSALIDLLSQLDEEIFLNQIVYLELVIGIDKSNKDHIKEEEFYDDVFSSYSVLDLDFQGSKKARDIMWSLRKEGSIIGVSDCAISGIYLSQGGNKIITKNKKHFENIKGLEVLDY